MFDVDCPRTPDEDNKDGAPTSAAKKNSNSSKGKPPIVRRNPSAAKVPSRPANNAEEGIEVSLPNNSATQYTPRSNKSKQLFSPRPRGGKGTSSSTRSRGGNGHRHNNRSSNKVGLEPEEFIISKPKATALPPRHSTSVAPRTPNAPHTPGKNQGHKVIQPNSSDGASVNMSQLNLTQQQQDTSLDNRSAHHMNNRPRTHSTEAFGPNSSSNIDDDEEEDIVGDGIGSNPFDGDTIDGGGRYIGPPIKKKKPTTLNTRSNSRGYWTEEIIDEENDKGMFCLFVRILLRDLIMLTQHSSFTSYHRSRNGSILWIECHY